MGELLACADQDCLRLTIIKLKFVLCHPIFNVRVAVGCASKERLYVVKGVAVIELGVISIEVVFEGMLFDGARQGGCIVTINVRIQAMCAFQAILT